MNECFLCGWREGLKKIMRWKVIPKAIKLVTDFICERCETKIEKEKKFKFKKAV